MKAETILISDWLKKNGGARRFEMGLTGIDYHRVKDFLAEHGWDLRLMRNSYFLKQLGARGIGKRVKWLEVIAKVDEIRRSRGLEPIGRAA